MTKINIDQLLNELQVAALEAHRPEKGYLGRKVAVNDTVRDLQEALEKQALTPRQEQKLAKVFFDSLAPLSANIFDRKTIEENSNLEKTLAKIHKERSGAEESVHTLREKVEQLKKKSPSDLHAKLIEQEAKLAIALGVKPKSGAGAMSNSYFLHDLRGKKIAIFKPDVEGARGKKNPKTRARINTVFAKKIFKFLSLRQMRQRTSEVFTYKASLVLNSPIVPPSKISTFNNQELGQEQPEEVKRGSLQVLVSGMTEAKDVLEIQEQPGFVKAAFSEFTRWLERLFSKTPIIEQLKRTPIIQTEKKEDKNDLPEQLFLVMAFLDFASGQIDRHFGNFMTQVADQDRKGGKIGVSVDRLGLASEKGKYLVMIDNGAALGRKHPKPVEARNMYLFSELPLAAGQIKFPPNFPPKHWDIELKDLFLDIQIEEDLHDLPSLKDKKQEIFSFFQDVPLTVENRKEAINQTKTLLFKKLATLSDNKAEVKKLQNRLGKMVEQLYTMHERLEVLKIFLDPPEGHEDKFSLQLLGSIRTAADYKAFWQMYNEITPPAK